MAINSRSLDSYELEVTDTNNPVLFTMVLIMSLIMKKIDMNNPACLLSEIIAMSTNDQAVVRLAPDTYYDESRTTRF